VEHETTVTRADIDALRRDLAGIAHQLAASRAESRQHFGTLHTRNHRADHRARATQYQVELQGVLNGVVVDLATWGAMLAVLLLSQLYVNTVANLPDWMRDLIPGVEQADPPPASKQVYAFSRPGQNLRKGDVVEGFEVTSGVGWRVVFGSQDWHEGYDLATPEGTPLYAVLPVEVDCLSASDSGGGGIGAVYRVGTEEHIWLHLSQCTPGYHATGSVFALTGNTGRSTGAHLDYRVRDEAAGWVKPYVNVLRLTLNPEADIQRSGARGTAGQHDQASTIELIKGFESFHATPYWDFAQYSWGYGTKAPGPTGHITEAEAERELIAYLETHCYPLLRGLTLTQGQVSALASFCYNAGPEQFSSSTLYARVLAGDLAGAAAEFDRWVHAEGQPLEGLRRRRAKEKALFLGQ
jgi:lysozyme